MPFEDYYALLDIQPGFSDILLLRRFLNAAKKAIKCRDHIKLLAIRRGFEVLRYEDSRISYYRMYRLLVRKEALRFPKIKRQEMLQQIRQKEVDALSGVTPTIEPGISYVSLQFKIIARIIAMDLLHIISIGASGVVMLAVIPIVVLANGFTWTTLVCSIILIPWALLALRVRTGDYVTYPRAGAGL